MLVVTLTLMLYPKRRREPLRCLCMRPKVPNYRRHPVTPSPLTASTGFLSPPPWLPSRQKANQMSCLVSKTMQKNPRLCGEQVNLDSLQRHRPLETGQFPKPFSPASLQTRSKQCTNTRGIAAASSTCLPPLFTGYRHTKVVSPTQASSPTHFPKCIRSDDAGPELLAPDRGSSTPTGTFPSSASLPPALPSPLFGSAWLPGDHSVFQLVLHTCEGRVLSASAPCLPRKVLPFPPSVLGHIWGAFGGWSWSRYFEAGRYG